MAKLIHRIGEVNRNKAGSLMKVIEYNNARDMWVKFEQGKPVHTSWFEFIRGKVANVYDKNIYGVGYLGEGEYKTWIDGNSPDYITWHDMLRRCYSEQYKEKSNTYMGCTVADEWHNFQVFAKWYEENYYSIENHRMHLDKDILVKGNKLYSPETCVFVPSNINSLFVKSNTSRGEFPIGVSYRKQNRKFKAECSNGKGERIFLGCYDTPEEAFFIYKDYKEKLIKQIAEEYRENIPDKLYEAMNNYIVEIND